MSLGIFKQRLYKVFRIAHTCSMMEISLQEIHNSGLYKKR